jgi:succinate dehydrogenase / fumarate reductase flavoprotein subunit
VNIIDQCVAQGVPFAREYGGLLANRSFGGAQVPDLLRAGRRPAAAAAAGPTRALSRSNRAGAGCRVVHRHEMLDLVVGGRESAAGSSPRNLVTGELKRSAGRTPYFLATGGYGNVVLPLHLRRGSNATGDLAGAPSAGVLPTPGLHADPPDLHPGFGRLPVEAHADVGVAAKRRPGLGAKHQGDRRPAARVAQPERDYFLERLYRRSGNLAPRISPRGRPNGFVTRVAASGGSGLGVYLDFSRGDREIGEKPSRSVTATCSTMYHEITGENAYEAPMRIFPAVHYTMGGLVGGLSPDEQHSGTLRPGGSELLRSRGEPVGRQRPHAGVGRRLLRFPTPSGIIFRSKNRAGPKKAAETEAFWQATEDTRRNRIQKLLGVTGKRPVSEFHRQLGKILWDPLRDEPDQERVGAGSRGDPDLAQGVLAGCAACPGAGRI